MYKYISDPCNTQSAQISQNQNGHNIYAIMKTMCPPGLSLQWLCANSCTWAHDVWLHVAGTLISMNQIVLKLLINI